MAKRWLLDVELGGQYSYAAKMVLPEQYYEWTNGASGAFKVLSSAGLTILNKLAILEIFNGQRFIDFTVVEPLESTTGGGGAGGGGGDAGGGGSGMPEGPIVRWTINIRDEQITSLNEAYSALGSSLYQATVVQTRLKPYLDTVELVIDEGGISFDASKLDAMLMTKKSADQRNALIDLLELNKYAQTTLQAIHFEGMDKLRAWVSEVSVGSELHTELGRLGVFTKANTEGSTEADVYFGDETENQFNLNPAVTPLPAGRLAL